MSVDFDRDLVKELIDKKRKVFLTKTGHMGEILAAMNIGEDGRIHIDTKTSSNAKQFRFDGPGRVLIEAPLFYDVYLERSYGIMARVRDELIPYMARFEEESFG